MGQIVLISVFIGTFTVTSYRSVPNQTDASPYYTSTGDHVCGDGVAVSQDLLKSGLVKYGDLVYISGVGVKRVNDTMNARWTNHWDVWVPNLDAEKAFHKKFKNKTLRIYKVQLDEKRDSPTSKRK